MDKDNHNKNTNIQNAKSAFFKKGTCSQAYFHILNKEFGHRKGNLGHPIYSGVLCQTHPLC